MSNLFNLLCKLSWPRIRITTRIFYRFFLPAEPASQNSLSLFNDCQPHTYTHNPTVARHRRRASPFPQQPFFFSPLFNFHNRNQKIQLFLTMESPFAIPINHCSTRNIHDSDSPANLLHFTSESRPNDQLRSSICKRVRF